LGELADVVLSDMAPSASGHAATDHLRIVALAEAAFSATSAILIPGGTFVPMYSRAAPRACCSRS